MLQDLDRFPKWICVFISLALVIGIAGCVTRRSVAPIPTALPPTTGSLAGALDALLSEQAAFGEFSGAALVARRDQVVLNQGYGLADRQRKLPNTPRTHFLIASVTKQFTAAAILLLQEQGKLSVQDRVCKHLSECPSAWEAVTLHHLLTHTSGIPNLIELPSYRKALTRAHTPEQVIATFKDFPLDFAPGEDWHYSNSGYILLGVVIERIAGMSYGDYLQEIIFDPLGMADSGYASHPGDLAVGYLSASTPAEQIDMSLPYAAGGLYSTVEDLYRWDRALMEGEVLSEASLAQSIEPQAIISVEEKKAYGYGWSLDSPDGRQCISHAGIIDGFRALNVWFPEEDLTVILLSNQQDQNPALILEKMIKLLFEGE